MVYLITADSNQVLIYTDVYYSGITGQLQLHLLNQKRLCTPVYTDVNSKATDKITGY